MELKEVLAKAGLTAEDVLQAILQKQPNIVEQVARERALLREAHRLYGPILDAIQEIVSDIDPEFLGADELRFTAVVHAVDGKIQVALDREIILSSGKQSGNGKRSSVDWKPIAELCVKQLGFSVKCTEYSSQFRRAVESYLKLKDTPGLAAAVELIKPHLKMGAGV